MKGFIGVAAALLLLFVMERTAARHIARQHSHHGHHHHTTTLAITGGHGEVKLNPNGFMERRRPPPRRSDPLRVAGSRLPDCSHACGSCSPCRLVMVSFVCASTAEAESCPMAYRCMCNNKSYPVP